MLAAAIAGACCVAVGAVLMTSAARSAATTVPVSAGPGGMWDSSGHTTPDTTGLVLWDSSAGTFGYHRQVHIAFRMVGSRGSSRTCSSRSRARPASPRW